MGKAGGQPSVILEQKAIRKSRVFLRFPAGFPYICLSSISHRLLALVMKI